MESAQQHDSKQASPAPVSFKPALLGAGLLFSVFLNAIRFFSEHGTGATPSLHPFAVYAGWPCWPSAQIDARPTSPARRLW